MPATITISGAEIRQVFQQRRFASASRFGELAHKANYLAAIVESRWEQLPAPTQELFAVFARHLIEPPQGIKQRFLDFLGRFHLAVVLFGMAIQGETHSFVACHNAFDRLVSAILNAVERENKAYQQALSEALEGAFSEWETTEAMTAEEACERIRQISERALTEL